MKQYFCYRTFKETYQLKLWPGWKATIIKAHSLLILWTAVQTEILLSSQFPESKELLCMSQTPITRWLWSQPRSVGNNRQELLLLPLRTNGVNTLWGRKGFGWRRGASRYRAFVREKEPQCSTRNEREEVSMDYRVGLLPPNVPKALQPIFRKAWKNRLHMVTNLYGKQETYIWGRETCP